MKTRRFTRIAAVAGAALLGLGITGAGTAVANAEGAPSQTVPECTQPMLSASVTHIPNSDGAGRTAYQLRLRNVSSQNCRIAGFPGVSVVGHGDGTQIGQPADRTTSPAGQPKVLIPNASSDARIIAVNIDENGGPLGSDCKVVKADGWRIYPPNGTRALYAPYPGLIACSSDTTWLQVTQMNPTS